MLAFLLLFFSSATFALPLPEPGNFQIKQIEDKNILYVVHTDEQGHISNSLIKLVQYYLLNESDAYEVVFPQLSIESARIHGSYYAIGYRGNPKETETVKTTKAPGGLFASYIYQGNYAAIGIAIRSVFRKILETGRYAPHGDEEIRLLYWNSIDDHHPSDLITEIQVRVLRLP